MFFLTWPFKLIQWVLFGIWNVVVVTTCVLTLAGYYGDKHWLLGLMSHFLPQYLVIQLIAIILLILSKYGKVQRVLCLLLLGCAAFFNLKILLPYYYPSSDHKDSTVGHSLKIFHYNVLGTNRDSTSLIKELILEKPDIVTFAEYNDWWRRTMEGSGALAQYPYKSVVPYGNDAIYSKYPLTNIRIEKKRFDAPNRKSPNNTTVTMQLDWQGRNVTLILLHPRPAVKPHWAYRQRVHFQDVISHQSDYLPDKILLGDLNTTPWSLSYQDLCRSLNLRDSSLGFGYQPTWPTFFPSIMRVDIDHVLVSPNFQVLTHRTGHPIGSDHLPVIVELGFRPEVTGR